MIQKYTDEDYTLHLNEVATTIRTSDSTNKPMTLRDIVELLQLDRDNRAICEVCVDRKIATKAEFNREIDRARQRALLGIAPANATELVEAFGKTYNVRASMDGMYARDVEATLFNTATGEYDRISADDRASNNMLDLYAAFTADARSRMNRIDFERELRILSTNLRMGIGERDIADAAEEWTKKAHRERLYEIFMDVESVEYSFDAGAAWLAFAEAVFDCSETSPEFVAAVVRKFIWQVKRKLRGLPVTDHLMPVILGPQGIGKSTLVNRLLAPVEELKLNVDFQMVTDDRNVEIWSSYVMFLDEMGFASKADIDAVKGIITATTLTRRPMRSNSKVTIDQKATFIGCSNKELGQLVRDPTGNRRFVGIRMRSDADRKMINSLDFGLMWGNVPVTGADPMIQHRTVLAAEQEGSRERSRVEQWMADFEGANNSYQAGINKAGNIAAADLYRAFRDYEDENYPGNFKTSKNDWDQEMARLRKNSPEAVCFSHQRGGKGIMYRWTQEPLLRAVE